jgi:hypothetical protein
VQNYRTAEANFVKGTDLLTVEELDPEALPAEEHGSDHAHTDVRGAP